MASKKKVKLAAGRAAAAVASNLQCLSASVTHHLFSFLTTGELAQAVFRVCRSFRALSADGRHFSVLSIRGATQATVIALIERAKGNLQELSLLGCEGVTDATLTALAANASPARFRLLDIRRSTPLGFTGAELRAFLASWTSARNALVARGAEVVPLTITCGIRRIVQIDALDTAAMRSQLVRERITLDGFAAAESGEQCSECDKRLCLLATIAGHGDRVDDSVACYKCAKSCHLCEGACVIACETCGERSCGDCMRECDKCLEWRCSECFSTCEFCDWKVCCTEDCALCGKTTCGRQDCVKSWGVDTRPKCGDSCYSCDTWICQDAKCGVRCTRCNNVACSENCDDSGFATCANCKKVHCPDCSCNSKLKRKKNDDGHDDPESSHGD